MHSFKFRQLLGLLILCSTSIVFAANNGNGGGNGGNPTEAIAALESELNSLRNAIDSLSVMNVSADCGLDNSALQTAVNAAPQAGAIISVTGSCGATVINGKSNLVISGGTISGGLQIEASRNIQLSNMDIDAAGADEALLISYTSSVVTNGNLGITGSLSVRSNSSFSQLNGNISVTGQVLASQSGAISIRNGTLNGGAVLDQNSSLSLFPDSPAYLINLAGTLQAFSGANITLRADNNTNHGAISVTVGDVYVQRNASMRIFGSFQNADKILIDMTKLWVRQNAAFDMLDATSYIGSISLTDGGGARIFTRGVPFGSIHADCDASAWASLTATCEPPLPSP